MAKHFLFFLFLLLNTAYAQVNCLTPSRVEVLPVFFVPNDEEEPTTSQKDSLMHYLRWAQTRYYEMLKQRSTFTIARQTPYVFHGSYNNSFYESQNDGGAGAYINELLVDLGYTRFNCPYVFVVIYMHPESSYPQGGGRPMNAGYNTGGGVVIMSSYDLDNTPSFETTLQHELGHSFGLVHPDSYGYSMTSDSSIMSYNQDHLTNWFTPSATPGTLNAEDLRALSLHKLAFPEMYFDSLIDIPGGYLIFPDYIILPVFPIPEQDDYEIIVSSSTSSQLGTIPGNIVQHRIKPNLSGMGVQFDAANMWHSGFINDWAFVVVDFPLTVTLDKIGLHAQHSGQYHQVDSIKIEYYSGGDYVTVLTDTVSNQDQWFAFTENTSDKWKIYFKPGVSQGIVIRGLQFYYLDEEVFPPLIPYDAWNPFLDELPSSPLLNNPANGYHVPSFDIDLSWSGQQALEYRLQIDTNKNFCSPLVNEILSVDTYNYTIPFDNTAYYWRVKGLNDVGQGFGLWSEIREFAKGTIEGITENETNEIIVFPNPSNGDITIHSTFSNNTKTQIEIHNITGQTVFYHEEKIVPGIYKKTINLNLGPGVYYLNLKSNKIVATKKIEIIK